MTIEATDDRLLSFIERIERMNEEKKGIHDDIKDAYAEAKATGYNTKMMRKVIKLREIDRQTRKMEEAELEAYRAAVGID